MDQRVLVTVLVSWGVAMSYGFVLTLHVEPDKLRALNRYDFAPIAEQLKKDHA